jgi:phosphoribosylformimino-5-aminoimidazole carboxamide ribonucleotide (ProFAR) isomerase
MSAIPGKEPARDFCKAVDAKICIAGSINSYKRIDTMFEIGPWSFTMGTALFDKNYLRDGSFRDNLQAVVNYMDQK